MDADVLVIGEALIDIVETPEGDEEFVGGSPANVAVGLARQGHAVRLLTRIGRDDRGARIAAQIEDSGAGVDDRSWTDAATSTARARLRADGSAEYEFAIDWDIPVSPAAGVRAVHTGSIALFLEPGATAVRETLRAAAGAAFVSIDPNIRPALVGERERALARFADAAASADLVKLSDEDAAWLYPDASAEEVLERIAGYGPRLVVMTRGAEGAIGRGPGGIIAVAPLTVTVADTIGAGDAYMASLISSVLDDPTVVDDVQAFAAALRRAAVMAGITVSRAGANPPSRAEIDSRLG
ncbi:carbohydrate kinase family protein [Microbacterium dextranolyticum]|uniref:Ribokinase n=1 Tax=Microbacterium dextranolyticum TaxID=36806 RepID=A0A9W6HKQ4_9MICO|nr:carbohydrate kinase [Microbacterium dextranolyticum]MBM7462059.1 fructokinase [Microbacterium dextranolyticum]GLJ94303.1 ribokinase [Microbacterium dextranolyticum]